MFSPEATSSGQPQLRKSVVVGRKKNPRRLWGERFSWDSAYYLAYIVGFRDPKHHAGGDAHIIIKMLKFLSKMHSRRGRRMLVIQTLCWFGQGATGYLLGTFLANKDPRKKVCQLIVSFDAFSLLAFDPSHAEANFTHSKSSAILCWECRG